MIRVAVSPSRTNVMQSCWQKYEYEYIQRWTPIQKGAALERGSLVHTFFKYYYNQKLHQRWRSDPSQQGIVLDEATNVCRRDAVDMSISVKDAEDDIRVARENLIFHAQDGMEVFAVEEPFSKVLYEIPDAEGVEGVQIIFEGIVDLIARLPNSKTAVWDHKTEGRKSTPSKLSNQFQGEAWAFDVDEVVVNKIGFQTSLKENEKYRRLFLDYPTELIQEWKVDTVKTVLEAIERHRRADSGKKDWPRNRTSCDKYSGCIFKQVCEAKPIVRPVKLQTWYRQRSEHEIYEAEKRPKGEVDVEV